MYNLKNNLPVFKSCSVANPELEGETVVLRCSLYFIDGVIDITVFSLVAKEGPAVGVLGSTSMVLSAYLAQVDISAHPWVLLIC